MSVVQPGWRSWPLVRHLRAIWLRRLTPLAGGRMTRGTVIVRYYWARFLERHRGDIRGRGLEIGETTTLRRYGGTAITSAEALDLAPHHDAVTVVADLTGADHVAADQYDCFIVPFTMTVIYDVDSALYHAVRILKPGGVLLINFACVDYYLYRGLDMGTGAPLYMYWWFTPLQVEELLHRCGLTPADYQLDIQGNLFSRIAFQLNMPIEDLSRAERDTVDPGHPLLISVRIVKPAGWAGARPTPRQPQVRPGLHPARLDPAAGHYGDAYR